MYILKIALVLRLDKSMNSFLAYKMINKKVITLKLLLILHAVSSLVFPLLLIFNYSLTLSEKPNQWKTSYVIPVHKKGNKHNPLNYRPISLISTFSWIFKHIISQKIFNHLFDFNLLTPKQFGFVPHQSSGIQLLTCLHAWLITYFNKKSITVI